MILNVTTVCFLYLLKIYYTLNLLNLLFLDCNCDLLIILNDLNLNYACKCSLYYYGQNTFLII